MHVSLLIDLLAAWLLVAGLFTSIRPARRLLCLICLLYLSSVAVHYYLVFAPWFGFFHSDRPLTAIWSTALLNFFGGFWTFFGVMVLVKGVTWCGLAIGIFDASNGRRAKGFIFKDR